VGDDVWLLEHAEGHSQYLVGLSDVLDVIDLYGDAYQVSVG